MLENQQKQQSKESKCTFKKQIAPTKQIQVSNPVAIVQPARIETARIHETINEECLNSTFKSKPKKETCTFSSTLPIHRKEENLTGMPYNLKTGIEYLSGIDMSNVRVHYNSDKPAEIGALAYTQGIDIYIAPGQEKHLPHEAWHVVQQAQGRVRPTFQMEGVVINDDMALEKEADVMGEKAFAIHAVEPVQLKMIAIDMPLSAVQRYVLLNNDDNEWIRTYDEFRDEANHDPNSIIVIGKVESAEFGTTASGYVWLEQGNQNAGLTHIMNHIGQFNDRGVYTHLDIIDYIFIAIETGTVVDYQGGPGRPIIKFRYATLDPDAHEYLALTIGDNGYIVGANPTASPYPDY